MISVRVPLFLQQKLDPIPYAGHSVKLSCQLLKRERLKKERPLAEIRNVGERVGVYAYRLPRSLRSMMIAQEDQGTAGS